MEANLQQQIAFFLTGRRGPSLRPMDVTRRPALTARVSDLTSLRYDFPIVLNRTGDFERPVRSLTDLVSEAIEALGDTPGRDRVARHGHRIEMEMRRRLAAGATSDVAELWRLCAAELSRQDETLEVSAERMWPMLNASGEIVDVDEHLPVKFVKHEWKIVQNKKAAAFRQKAERLLLKLRDILEAETVNSPAGRAPDRLKAGVGVAFAGMFDFNALSDILVEARPGGALPDSRRARIHELIAVLEDQRFYPLNPAARNPYSFEFENSTDALEAYQERHSEAVKLLKTLRVAELEVNGEYRESVYDDLFAGFGANGLDPGQLESLPDYLVTINSSTLDAAESGRVTELLAAGLPVRVMIQTDDLLEPSAVAEGHVSLGLRSRQIVNAAIGLTDVFVMQASASGLYGNREALADCLSFAGPSLICVFSGVNQFTKGVPPYLVAAAATESRAFPTLIYDPSSGPDWASRLKIEMNPALENDWPSADLAYEDVALQARSETAHFTLADFMAMDVRFHSHFAVVEKPDWTDAMVTVPDALGAVTVGLPDEVPSITLVDADGRLERAIVGSRVLSETRRCRTMWCSLQELGGINNSHARRLMGSTLETQAVEAAVPPLAAAPTASPALKAETEVTPNEVEAPAAEEIHGDEPFIETARCTTCNECTQINNKMFAYNENQQAYIADASAGTFRELVEAAESCQVSIIHPGKPANPKEPGIEDLIRRAAEFN